MLEFKDYLTVAGWKEDYNQAKANLRGFGSNFLTIAVPGILSYQYHAAVNKKYPKMEEGDQSTKMEEGDQSRFKSLLNFPNKEFFLTMCFLSLDLATACIMYEELFSASSALSDGRLLDSIMRYSTCSIYCGQRFLLEDLTKMAREDQSPSLDTLAE